MTRLQTCIVTLIRLVVEAALILSYPTFFVVAAFLVIVIPDQSKEVIVAAVNSSDDLIRYAARVFGLAFLASVGVLLASAYAIGEHRKLSRAAIEPALEVTLRLYSAVLALLPMIAVAVLFFSLRDSKDYKCILRLFEVISSTRNPCNLDPNVRANAFDARDLLRWSGISMVVAAIFLSTGIRLLKGTFGRVREFLLAPIATAGIGRHVQRVHAVSALALILIGILVLSPSVGAVFFDSLSLVLIWILLFVLILPILRLPGALIGVPLPIVFVILAVVAALSGINDNHRIREVPQQASIGTGGDPKPGAAYWDKSIGDVFAAWLSKRPDRAYFTERRRPYPVFIVTADGGGLYAAYFTGMVLARLQDTCPGFHQHLFAISGVSGGSIGAATYAALVHSYAIGVKTAPCDPVDGPKHSIEKYTDEILATDFLTPLVSGLFFADFVQRFIPWPIERFDRARALENAFEQAWSAHDGPKNGRNVLGRAFADFWKQDGSSLSPALLLNTTNVETGRVITLSPFNTHPDHVNDRSLKISSISAIARYLSERTTLSTASVLSARFPIVTPTGHLVLEKSGNSAKFRFADGGYYENTGTSTVLNVIRSIRRTARQNNLDIQIVLIRIGTEDVGGVAASESVEELWSPVKTMLNTRRARAVYSTEEARTLMTSRILGDYLPYHSFLLRENMRKLPLGWTLSRVNREYIAKRAGTWQLCDKNKVRPDERDDAHCDLWLIRARLMGDPTY